MTAVTAVLGAWVVRGLAATLRLQVVGIDPLRELWRGDRPLIYAVWHGRILMVPWANARLRRAVGARPVTVLASRSRDGELVSAFVRRFGLATVRGSSSRAGASGLRQLARAVSAGHDVAVVPDGPRGPRLTLQPGIVTLAVLTGAPVVPVAFAARPARRLRSWDEFLVPLPFGRGVLAFGEPLWLARDADRERAGKDVERALLEVTAVADRLAAA